MPLSSSLFTTAVRGDVLPAVGSLLVPGALAAGPYVALLWGPPHNLKMFVEESEGLSAVVGALVVVAAGLLIESIGSYAEYYLIDRVHKNKEEMFSRWQEYLQLRARQEITDGSC
jgi:hypothetical protein